jgi:4-hydroxy-tetrahydrodipicolinate synthase
MAEFTRSEAKAWAKQRVRDFYAAPITPLTKDFQLDEAGIRDNIEAYIDWGVDGLVIGGFANETWNMRPEWWYRLHEITADAVRGRTDLWTIILDPCAEVCIDKLKHVEKLGFSGAELMNPMTQLRGDDEIYNFFKYVTDRSDLAICLYRTPVSGKVMGLELLKRLVDIPTVVCTKQGNLNRAESLLLRRSLRDDFIVSDPTEHFYLDDLREGGQVLFAEFSYLIYGRKRSVLRSYVNKARAGDWEGAYADWKSLRPIWYLYEDEFMNPLIRTASYASLMSVIKIWCETLGLKAGPMKPPVEHLPPADRERLVGRIKELGLV